jgi:hypothetical protein
MTSGEEDRATMGRYQQSWFSWYFSIPDMKITDVIFDIPEHIYFFANLPQKNINDKIELLYDTIPYGISFFLLEKRYYEKITVNNYNLCELRVEPTIKEEIKISKKFFEYL